MQYYESYDTVPVWNFYKVLETEDVTYLLHNRTDKANKEKLTEVFHEIYSDRVDYLDSNNIKLTYQVLSRLNNMEFQLECMINSLSVFAPLVYKSKGWEIIEDSWDFNIKAETKEDYLNKFNNKIKGLKSKIRAFKINNKEYLDNGDGQTVDLEREKILLNEVLPNQNINIRQTSLKEWDAVAKLARERLKNRANESRRKN